MNLSTFRILVVGAAAGGASTALLLARAGAQVTLIDRVAEFRAVGAGLSLAANGRAVLEALGLWPALIGDGSGARAIRGARLIDQVGRTLMTPPDGAELAVVTRARLQEVLLDAVMAEPRITCRFGVSLERAGPDGIVTLHDDSEEGRKHPIPAPLTMDAFDLVIGADGVHSQVRACGNFGAQVTDTGITYLRALTTGTGPGIPGVGGRSSESASDAVEAWTPAGLFGALPTSEGHYIYGSADAPDVREAIVQRDLEGVARAWGLAWRPAAALLRAVDTIESLLVNRVLHVNCTRWHDGRLVLLGDAAHAMAPNLGQGANSALVDAAVLVDALRHAATLEEGLIAYTVRRREAVGRVARSSAALGWLAERRHVVARFLRDRLLWPIAARLTTSRQLNQLLQESPEVLRRMVTEAMQQHPNHEAGQGAPVLDARADRAASMVRSHLAASAGRPQAR
ncbi:MAG: FAD-dependent monooxygenase [Gemmatimonadaceae bacterium]|nr:FAD-dependent monooxygenase [Gemmatimonadaceae bacterium]